MNIPLQYLQIINLLSAHYNGKPSLEDALMLDEPAHLDEYLGKYAIGYNRNLRLGKIDRRGMEEVQFFCKDQGLRGPLSYIVKQSTSGPYSAYVDICTGSEREEAHGNIIVRVKRMDMSRLGCIVPINAKLAQIDNMCGALSETIKGHLKGLGVRLMWTTVAIKAEPNGIKECSILYKFSFTLYVVSDEQAQAMGMSLHYTTETGLHRHVHLY